MVLVGWLCFTSHRQRDDLKTAPPFTITQPLRHDSSTGEWFSFIVYEQEGDSPMDCHATARGSIPGGNGVKTELHVLLSSLILYLCLLSSIVPNIMLNLRLIFA